MKKLNLVCASIALAFGATAASAGTLTTAVSGGTVFATENFGGADSAAADTITMGAVTYSMSTITAVNAGATVYFTIRLDGGKFVAAPAFGTIKFAGASVANGAAVGAQAGATIALSTDKTTALVTIVNGNTSATLGLGAFTWTPAAGSVNNVNTTLATAGGAVTATVGLTTTAPTAYEATDALTTVDAPLASATAAVAKAAITGAASGTISATYAGKIDLTASPVASKYTGVGAVDGRVALGKITFTNVTGTQANVGGTTDYTLVSGSAAADNLGLTATVTPGAGQAFPVGSKLTLNSATDCESASDLGGLSGTGQTAFTAATAGTAKTITTTDAVVTATPIYVCMLPPSGTGNVAAPITPTISAVVKPAATTDLIATASGTGYALDYNGSKVDTNTYWPAALQTYGYLGYTRIINTGKVAANVSGAFINPTTGAVGASAVLTSTPLAAGAHIMLSSADVEAKLGPALSGLTAGRLRVTAPTDGLKVQSFVQVNGAPPQETSGAQ